MSAVVVDQMLHLLSGALNFWTVECFECGMVLTPDGTHVHGDIAIAKREAAEHNAEVHGPCDAGAQQ